MILLIILIILDAQRRYGNLFKLKALSLPGSPAVGVATLCSHQKIIYFNDNTPTVIRSALRERGKFDLTDPNLV